LFASIGRKENGPSNRWRLSNLLKIIFPFTSFKVFFPILMIFYHPAEYSVTSYIKMSYLSAILFSQ
ncbi:MAG: hypothetical protein OEZ27_07200, partial [Nitrospinota bacterium]|nr:hypothetical protein [Nitrospinota bacterium]